MLKYSWGLDAAADEIEQATVRVLSLGYRTVDIDMNGTKRVGTKEMGDLVVKELI